MRPRRVHNPADLGWLYLIPGIILVAAAVLIAAEDDLHEARFRRDEALAIERRHAERVNRYEAYARAVQRRDATVVRALVVGQLNATPTDLVEEHIPGLPVFDPAEIFASLEPPAAEPAHRVRTNSVLARWATDDSSRIWMLASGALCTFVGLLPPATRRRDDQSRWTDDADPDAATDIEADESDDPETDGDEQTEDGDPEPALEIEDEDTDPTDDTEAADTTEVEQEDPEPAALLDSASPAAQPQDPDLWTGIEKADPPQTGDRPEPPDDEANISGQTGPDEPGPDETDAAPPTVRG